MELAETAGIPVYDVDSRLNFPTRHPLNMSHAKDVFRDADLVLCLDTRDWERPTTELVSTTRELTSIVPAGATWIDIGFGDLELSSWALDYQRLRHARAAASSPTRRSRSRRSRGCSRPGSRRTRRCAPASRRARPTRPRRATRCREKWAREAKVDWDASPITLPRLASEVWDAIKGEDWVLTRRHARTVDAQALGLRQALSPSRTVARHGDPVRHLARRGARAPRRRSGSSSTCSPTAT